MAGTEIDAPAGGAVSVTPDDDTDLSVTSRALYIGGGDGTLAVVMHNGTEVSFAGIVTGSVLPIRVSRVKSTGTGATDIIALY